MRYHIDTIPVWDAYKEGGECPLCRLRAAMEERYLAYALGDSLMEPAVRVETNQKGFCREHFAMMLPRRNRLGLGLMTHTHLLSVIEQLEGASAAALDADRKGLLARSKGSPQAKGLRDLAEAARARASSCTICDQIEETMKRYAYTTVHLFEKDAEFRKAFEASRGACLTHFALLLDMAADEFSEATQRDLAKALVALELESLRRLAGEVEWFTLKFDYRNADKPWGESRDAIERALLKLRSLAIAEGAKKEET